MTQEALKLAIQLRDTASGYWTANEIPIIEKLIELLAQPEQEPLTYLKLCEQELNFAELEKVISQSRNTHETN